MKITYPIIILILIAIIFLQRECNSPIKPDTIIIHDTINYSDTIYKPKPYEVIKYQYKNIHHYKIDTVIDFALVDTMAILSDYFAKYVYKDTILNDTNGFITIYDTITKNRILSRSVHKKFYPTTYTVTTPIKHRTKVYIGFGANGWLDKFGVSINMALLTKQDHLYSIGYDPLNKNVAINLYWKIRLRNN